MHQTLRLHPDSRCRALTGIAVDAVRARDRRLMLRYAVNGAIDDVRLPPVTEAARTDELWRHTCFEAFIRAVTGEAYYEFNFAPSTQWAAYRFDGYRSGMRVADAVGAPQFAVRADDESFELQVSLDLAALPDLPDGAWQLGLSAVIEEASGGKSYWALAHAAGKPDFHHADCFCLELPAA